MYLQIIQIIHDWNQKLKAQNLTKYYVLFSYKFYSDFCIFYIEHAHYSLGINILFYQVIYLNDDLAYIEFSTIDNFFDLMNKLHNH